MKNFLLILVSLLLSFNSYGEWMKASSSDSALHYLDIDNIRKNNGYIYYWVLSDLIKPFENGDASYKIYHQGDCGIFRHKLLSYHFHKKPMGGGVAEVFNDETEWKYPVPEMVDGVVLKRVCEYVQ